MKIGELGMIASRSPVEVDYEFFLRICTRE